MIPAPFAYKRAESPEQAIELLSSCEDAKLLAGGHSLLPLMKLRLARPATLIDIGRLRELSYIREESDWVAIGALTRHHDVHVSEELRTLCPIVSHAAGEIGDPQVRHVGTIGGSVAHADPASDMPAVLVALDAEMVVQGPSGARTSSAGGFFKGLFEPDLAPDELLTEIRVPKTAERKWSFIKFNRRAQDWAIVGVSVLAANGSPPAVALTNMSDRPLRASSVEQALAEGAGPSIAAEHATERTRPPSDTFASAEYRRELAKVLVRRALEETMR